MGVGCWLGVSLGVDVDVLLGVMLGVSLGCEVGVSVGWRGSGCVTADSVIFISPLAGAQAVRMSERTSKKLQILGMANRVST